MADCYAIRVSSNTTWFSLTRTEHTGIHEMEATWWIADMRALFGQICFIATTTNIANQRSKQVIACAKKCLAKSNSTYSMRDDSDRNSLWNICKNEKFHFNIFSVCTWTHTRYPSEYYDCVANETVNELTSMWLCGRITLNWQNHFIHIQDKIT